MRTEEGIEPQPEDDDIQTLMLSCKKPLGPLTLQTIVPVSSESGALLKFNLISPSPLL
jgi:hypothetical protein